MKKNICRLLILFCLLPYACTKKKQDLPIYNTPDFTPYWMVEGKEPTQKETHTIAPFSFQNQHGETITNKNLEGKIHIVNFFFTSCGSICPKMIKNLLTIQQDFETDEEVVILSHSVTPWIDSTKILQEYAEKI